MLDTSDFLNNHGVPLLFRLLSGGVFNFIYSISYSRHASRQRDVPYSFYHINTFFVPAFFYDTNFRFLKLMKTFSVLLKPKWLVTFPRSGISPEASVFALFRSFLFLIRPLVFVDFLTSCSYLQL